VPHDQVAAAQGARLGCDRGDASHGQRRRPLE